MSGLDLVLPRPGCHPGPGAGERRQVRAMRRCRHPTTGRPLALRFLFPVPQRAPHHGRVLPLSVSGRPAWPCAPSGFFCRLTPGTADHNSEIRSGDALYELFEFVRALEDLRVMEAAVLGVVERQYGAVK